MVGGGGEVALADGAMEPAAGPVGTVPGEAVLARVCLIGVQLVCLSPKLTMISLPLCTSQQQPSRLLPHLLSLESL